MLFSRFCLIQLLNWLAVCSNDRDIYIFLKIWLVIGFYRNSQQSGSQGLDSHCFEIINTIEEGQLMNEIPIL